MLTSRLGSFEALTVLDLFAGSGALGLEALSRGAAKAILVEQDRAALDALRANVAKLEAKGADVRACSVMALGQAAAPCDLIFADAPYGTGAGSVAIDKLGRLGWIAPGAWISVETGLKEDVVVKGYSLDSERRIGKAKITLLRPEADPH